MSDWAQLIPYGLAVLAVVGAWAVGLAYLDVFTPDDVRAWRRLARLRGYAAPRGRMEKFVSRARFTRRVQDELDLHRLLAVVGRDETPLGYLLESVLIALISVAACLGLFVAARIVDGDWPMPLVVVPAVGAVVFLLRVSWLRSAAQRHQELAGRALGDMMMLVAIMTDGRGLQLEDAVRILSRCVDHDALRSIVDSRGWERLVRQRHHTTIELYRMIADSYRIPLFDMLADAAGNANVGFSERDTFTRMAKAVYQQRLAEARFRAARAKILVTIPVAGMLIPLLLLLGAPTFSSITAGLGGG